MLDHPPFWQALQSAQRVLLAGAGGGYDVYCGLPLLHRLQAQGKEVFLASLSFSQPDEGWGTVLQPGLVEVRAPAAMPPRCGAEVCLAAFLGAPVFCLGADGVVPVLAHYQRLHELLEFDAVVLVDGGTDSLLRGDEPGLGSPGEDVVSLAAVWQLPVKTRLLASLGFGLDAHHHVCHAYVLEAAAELTATGDFLGVFSLLAGMPEFDFFAAAVEHAAQQPGARPSIIAGSVVAAAQGRFGDHHASQRTRGSQLLVNPLMSMYWCFRLDGLARRCQYLAEILPTLTRGEVTQAIHRHRQGVPIRPWLALPF